MTDHSDLVARLRTTWPLEGVGPITREQRERIHEAAALIETQAAELERLRGELAGRDARIAAWLRNGAKGIRKDSEDGLWDDEDEAELIADDWEFLATAIEAGSHLEDATHD